MRVKVVPIFDSSEAVGLLWKRGSASMPRMEVNLSLFVALRLTACVGDTTINPDSMKMHVVRALAP